jgi:hypothetical protein
MTNLKLFNVTYYNAVKKSENSLTVRSSSLESATLEEEKAIAMIQQFNPFISIKSIVKVTA